MFGDGRFDQRQINDLSSPGNRPAGDSHPAMIAMRRGMENSVGRDGTLSGIGLDSNPAGLLIFLFRFGIGFRVKREVGFLF